MTPNQFLNIERSFETAEEVVAYNVEREGYGHKVNAWEYAMVTMKVLASTWPADCLTRSDQLSV